MFRLIDCIAAVAFDLDGTLIDTAPDLATAANMMLVMLGGRPLPEESIPSLIGGGIDRLVGGVLEQSRAETAVDPALQTAAGTLFRGLYAQRLFERSRVYPGAVETLQAFASAAIPAFCITNKESRFALPLIEAAGLSKRIKATLCADRPEDRKPNPSLLRAACAQIGLEPAELLYVGDSASDVVAAHAAGCRVVAVDYGYGDPVSLAEAHPDDVVSHLPDILTIGMRPQPVVRRLRVVS